MNSVQLEYLQFFLFNTTAAKCALGTALIVATLWAFVVKPLLQHYCGFSTSTEPLVVVGHRLITHPITTTTPTKTNTKNKTNNNNNNNNTGETTPGGRRTRRRSSSPRRSPSAVIKAEANHVSNMLADAAKKKKENTKVSTATRYVTPAPSVTDEALANLFHTPAFVRWYELHRHALLQRVQVRSAQELWMSIATLVVLLFGVFVLPFFSFHNTDASLWLLLQERYKRRSHVKSMGLNNNNNNNNNTKNTNTNSSYYSYSSWSVLFPELCVYAEALLLLVAMLTLLTTAFMPSAAAQTATTTLLAFLVLFCEAAFVQRVAVGAGFAALIAVVAWRVRSVCEV